MSTRDSKVAAAAVEENAVNTNVLLIGQYEKDKDGNESVKFNVQWIDVVYRANTEFGGTDSFDVRKSSFSLPFYRFKAICETKFNLTKALNKLEGQKRTDFIEEVIMPNVAFDIQFIVLEEGQEYTDRRGFHYEPSKKRRAIQDIVCYAKKALIAKYPAPITNVTLDDSWE